ncbi:cupin domain-containing protein [Marinicellulosiphila megalodicopiae]|uniref:cupin domain-containing protein n=1 Tax=Marinicellulosiphila megalodicopiae TaxID=2724896 RepID=UPI003BAFFC9A
MSHPTIFDISNTLDLQTFIEQYWQKKPCVIKGAWTDFECPVEADELAGLSLEDDVESRIISNIDDKWDVQQGPFTDDTFAQLPEQNWTLLIQGSDHFVEEVHQLRSYFDFLPSWLLDDVMISFATDQGTVGAHYDQFNVFLLQAEGKRTWHLAKQAFTQTPKMIEPLPVKVLETMPEYETFEVENGDLIYIPPGFAHHGISQGNSISLSFGYRGPSISETVGQIGFVLDETLNEFKRLSFDPIQTQPTYISKQHIAQAKQQIIDQLSDDVIAQLLGQQFTELKQSISENKISTEHFKAMVEQDQIVYKALNARIAFTDQTLFANGEKYNCTDSHIIELLTEQCEFGLGQIPTTHLELIHQLLESGVLESE